MSVLIGLVGGLRRHRVGGRYHFAGTAVGKVGVGVWSGRVLCPDGLRFLLLDQPIGRSAGQGDAIGHDRAGNRYGRSRFKLRRLPLYLRFSRTEEHTSELQSLMRI